MTNMPFDYQEEMNKTIKKVHEKEKVKILGRSYQKVFIALHGLSGKEFQKELNKLR